MYFVAICNGALVGLFTIAIGYVVQLNGRTQSLCAYMVVGAILTVVYIWLAIHTIITKLMNRGC